MTGLLNEGRDLFGRSFFFFRVRNLLLKMLYIVLKMRYIVFKMRYIVFKMRYCLEGAVYSLEDDVYCLEDAVYSLEDAVYSLEDVVYCLEDDVYCLEDDVYCLEDDVYSLEDARRLGCVTGTLGEYGFIFRITSLKTRALRPSETSGATLRKTRIFSNTAVRISDLALIFF